MLDGTYRSLIILLVFVAFYLTDLAIITRYDKKRKDQTSGRSWGFTLAMAAAVIFLIAQPSLLPSWGLHIKAGWGILIQIAGLALLIGGLALHWWARVHLKQFYAERVEVQPDHLLIDSGPYACVRHPLFTAYFALALGILLINPSWPALLLNIYTFWDFTRAAKQEEELLSRKLPGYAEYMARTPRFLPRDLGCLKKN